MGRRRGRGYGGGGREIIYLSLHCHHQNDSSIKMGSDESHFSVSLIVRDGVHRQQLLKRKESQSGFKPRSLYSICDDDDMGLNVLGCWADILGRNCNL